MVKASEYYKDSLDTFILKRLAGDPAYVILHHRSCVNRYTSTTNCKTKLPEQTSDIKDTSLKWMRLSEAGDFCIKSDCLFCTRE